MTVCGARTFHGLVVRCGRHRLGAIAVADGGNGCVARGVGRKRGPFVRVVVLWGVCADGLLLSVVQMSEESVKERLEETRRNASTKLKGYCPQGAYMRRLQVRRCTDVNYCAACATAWSLKCTIGAQVVLCALTTGIGAAMSGRKVGPLSLLRAAQI